MDEEMSWKWETIANFRVRPGAPLLHSNPFRNRRREISTFRTTSTL